MPDGARFWVLYLMFGSIAWLCLQAQDDKVPPAERGLNGLCGHIVAWPLYVCAGIIFTIRKMW